MNAQRIDTTCERREQELLGVILLDNSQAQQIALSPSDFASVAHGQIYETAVRMVNAGLVTDALTVAEALERDTKRKDWLQITSRLVRDCVVSPSKASGYATLIRDASVARKAAAIGRRLADGGDVGQAIRALMDLTIAQKNHECLLGDAIKLAIDEIHSAAEGKPAGLSTGIRDIDDSLGGMHKGDLIVVAGRPAMGKTAFGLNVLCNLQAGAGLITAEQGRTQIGMRMLAIDGGISLHGMRNGKLADEEWSRLTNAMSALKNRPIRMNDNPGITIDEIFAQARQWKFHNDIGLLMVDYMQIINGGRGPDMRLQVGSIVKDLKQIARELHIPVLALSQVNREVEKRPMNDDGMGRMPFAGDIAESGIVEAVADQIITLYRPEVYDDRPEFKGRAFANFCKNRHGAVGFEEMHWRGEHLKFSDLAHTERDDESLPRDWSRP